MAKIIKRADPIECKNCGCVFEIEPSDIKMGYEDDCSLTSWVMGGVPCTYIRCPQCGKKKVIEWL